MLQHLSRAILTMTLTTLIGLGACMAETEPREFEMKSGDETIVMKRYYFLLYLRGERSEDYSEAELEEIQAGHLAHISKMVKEGVVCMAGPFGDDTEKRGLLIFDLETEESVREWIEQDPGVRSGRMSYEIHPWWGAKGSVLK